MGQYLMRPYVICHMMAPLDGRLIVSDWAKATGLTDDQIIGIYDGIHEEMRPTAWLSGRKTGEEFSDGVDAYEGVSKVKGVRPVHVARIADEYAVLLDNDGHLTWKKDNVDGAHVIVLLGGGVPDDHLGHLTENGVSYIVSKGERVDLRYSLGMLATDFGIESLMLEGGARTNGEFLKAGLVDEISHVVFPAVGGKSESPTVYETGDEELGERGQLRLMTCQLGDFGTVHLRYKVVNAGT